MTLNKASLTMCAVYLICAIAIVFGKATINSAYNFFITSLFTAWVFSPQAALCFSLNKHSYKFEKYILFAVQILFFAVSIIAYLQVLYALRPDAQSPLIIIWLPIWQLLGVIILEVSFFLIWLYLKLSRKILNKKNL